MLGTCSTTEVKPCQPGLVSFEPKSPLKLMLAQMPSPLPTIITIIFYYFTLFLICIANFPACFSVHHLHVWCPRKPEDSVRSSGSGVTISCEPMCVVGIKPRSPRAASALSHEAIPPALLYVIFNCMSKESQILSITTDSSS